MHHVGFNVEPLAHCCGAQDVGSFTVGSADFHDYRGKGATLTEAWADAVRKLLASQPGFSLQFWFVRRVINSKRDHAEAFDHEELRSIIKELPGAKCIAEEYVNPNSGNKIEGWIIYNNGEIKL